MAWIFQAVILPATATTAAAIDNVILSLDIGPRSWLAVATSSSPAARPCPWASPLPSSAIADRSRENAARRLRAARAPSCRTEGRQHDTAPGHQPSPAPY